MSVTLGDFNVHPSFAVDRDELYVLEGGRALLMHPLAVAELRYPNPLDRLPISMGIVLQRALDRLDSRVRALTIRPERKD
jgi:hypothetical protein